ncbi:release factor glutamine methyltransferase [Ulvibacter sp. MAR_2010_11]|uniref:peptide chain release factor N(5)-glutamine methyltransferase n=1 Tax=Ulvibacter sp. MAR_2010_11 TaxID=1250229 RepID=UPI000C2C0AF3|nr:peptide chain release factor N(5)-glutamine methyltransferase [Ulvibacter sp. MAR_2010_11]PKA81902.1 release factor glutamine methyltransferase [Ulvibacter sp. MAR_2010_11]
MTISDLKNDFLQKLSGLYSEEELQSFFVLLSEAFLKLTRLEIALEGTKTVSEEANLKFSEAIHRLKNHEPVQYILGETEFYGMVFKVNKNTLIPRPETEELVAWILATVETQKLKPKSILDIGTGSGCIAIALAKHLPESTISALDISSEALQTAQQNAFDNQVEVDFFQRDILQATNEAHKYDFIVSNPPYVRELEKGEMQPNVLQYEPKTALYVPNEDPLLFYRHIARFAKKSLRPKGFLFLEINEYLSEEMMSLLKLEGFVEVELKKDIFEKYRMIKATLNA